MKTHKKIRRRSGKQKESVGEKRNRSEPVEGDERVCPRIRPISIDLRRSTSTCVALRLIYADFPKNTRAKKQTGQKTFPAPGHLGPRRRPPLRGPQGPTSRDQNRGQFGAQRNRDAPNTKAIKGTGRYPGHRDVTLLPGTCGQPEGIST